MKIALYYHLDFGGAKRVVLEHAKGLQEKGHTIDLYVTNSQSDIFDPSPCCEHVYNYTVSLDSSLPFIKRFIADYRNFVSLKQLHRKIAQDIDSRQYDIVLAHPDNFTQAPFILRFLQTKSVYYCQEPLRIVYEYSMRLRKKVNIFKRLYEECTRLYRKKIDRENVQSATYTIASCCHVRERMIESYEVYPKVIYCAVDAKNFHQVKVKKLNRIFYVGSPNALVDGYDLVEKAIKLIPKNIRPQLDIVAWKKANGERLTEKELIIIYNQSIATLCTSRLETFGLVPLESMACGVPVIATNVGGHRETVVDGKTGFLVDFDPKEIADRIRFLIENPTIAMQMGKNARKHVEDHWTWKVILHELDTVLEAFVKER